MEIGILGLTFKSGNKGCEALSYSFLELLNELARKKNEEIKVNIITSFPTKLFLKKGGNIKKIKENYFPKIEYRNLVFDCLFFTIKGGKIFFLNSIKKCRCIFDYTAGDSFTDIYGEERFYTRTLCKKAIIEKKIPLILGSQTIGPFNDSEVRKMAVDVIKRAKEVYARDEMSLDYTEQISGRKAKLTSDIAFALPYNSPCKKSVTKIKIGFNPSGLLWNGGYTQNNQFDLRADYKTYCRTVIKELLKEYEVYLIAHAFTDNKLSMDNDMIAVEDLHNEFPETVVASKFETPMEIKSYIATMDIFIGARMHATIGAFSAGVPVIAFSYSRKFEGLFNSLNYQYVIHGKTDTTEEAIKKTIEYVMNSNKLRDDMQCGLIKTRESINFIKSELERLIYLE